MTVESHPCAKNAQEWGTRCGFHHSLRFPPLPAVSTTARGFHHSNFFRRSLPRSIGSRRRAPAPIILITHPADSLRTLYFFFPLLGLRGLGAPGLSPLLPFFFGAGESGVGGTPVGSEVILPLFRSTVTESRCITCWWAAVLNVMVRVFASVVTVR